MKFVSLAVSMTAAFALAPLAVVSADSTLTLTPPDGTANGKHIVLISGDEEYRSEESCPMLAKILSQHHGFRCTVLFAINKETGFIDPYQVDNIPGTDALDTADLCIIATRFRTLPDDQMRPIFDFLQSGKPFIALRTATHAFSGGNYGGYDWSNFGLNVVGENWHSHHGKHKVEGGRAVIETANAAHPILNSVADIYTPSDIYGVVHLDPAATTILLRGQILESLDPNAPPVTDQRNEPMMPLAWIKNYTAPSGKIGRVFATTAGASVDFLSPDLRRLVINAALYLTDQDVPQTANVDLVDSYEPTAYGFSNSKNYLKRKLIPADFGFSLPPSTAPDDETRTNPVPTEQ